VSGYPQKTTPRSGGEKKAGAPGPGPRKRRDDLAARLGLVGPEGLRRRGAALRRLLAGGDWIVLIGVLCVATALTQTTDVGKLFWAVLFSPTWILVFKLHGVYDNDHRRIRHSTLDEVPALISACALGTIALDGLLALSPVGPLSPKSAILVGFGTLIGSFAMRAVLRFCWHRVTGYATGVAVGSGAAADAIDRRIATHPEARLRLAGYLSTSAKDEAGGGRLPKLGSIDDLGRIAEREEVERVVVIGHELDHRAAERLIEQCKAAGLGLTFLPEHFGLFGPGIELNRLAELPVLDFRFSDPPRSTMAIKRAMDVTLSTAMLALLSPLLLVVSILILLDTGRPVFFRQKRAGLEGAPFTMLKFRTMVADAEERLADLVDLDQLEEPVFKIPDDPRVTRAGRLLRRTSVDELPQLINVLRGDMSMVGPRPEEEAVVALYDERQRARLAVRPGLTGPMQVYGRGDLTFEERLSMERDYLDNITLTGDLAILLRTPIAIVRGEGAY
jgi:exopolysaccharide biosynthesis polyprenyl glycosylphosphotransferase